MSTAYFTQTTLREAVARAGKEKRGRCLMPMDRLTQLFGTQLPTTVYPIAESLLVGAMTIRCTVLLNDHGLQGTIDLSWVEYQDLPTIAVEYEYITQAFPARRPRLPESRRAHH